MKRIPSPLPSDRQHGKRIAMRSKRKRDTICFSLSGLMAAERCVVTVCALCNVAKTGRKNPYRDTRIGQVQRNHPTQQVDEVWLSFLLALPPVKPMSSLSSPSDIYLRTSFSNPHSPLSSLVMLSCTPDFSEPPIPCADPSEPTPSHLSLYRTAHRIGFFLSLSWRSHWRRSSRRDGAPLKPLVLRCMSLALLLLSCPRVWSFMQT